MNDYLNKNTPPKSRTTRNRATHITNTAQLCLQKRQRLHFCGTQCRNLININNLVQTEFIKCNKLYPYKKFRSPGSIKRGGNAIWTIFRSFIILSFYLKTQINKMHSLVITIVVYSYFIIYYCVYIKFTRSTFQGIYKQYLSFWLISLKNVIWVTHKCC